MKDMVTDLQPVALTRHRHQISGVGVAVEHPIPQDHVAERLQQQPSEAATVALRQRSGRRDWHAMQELGGQDAAGAEVP